MSSTGVEAIAREDPRYPAALARMGSAPRVLYVAPDAERLAQLLREPAVAIVGTRQASDYGMETARSLARGLAASGVCVLGALAEGIAAAAHMGALEVHGPTVTVMKAGLDRCHPASCTALYERVREAGCAVGHVAGGCEAPRWSYHACMRMLAGMAQLVIVVEARDSPGELAAARIAQALDRDVAAVPGRVCSPLAQGPHTLLREGARLVRGAQDALDALYGVGSGGAADAMAALEPPQQALLEQVAGGRDTLAKLTAGGEDPQRASVALAELELSGTLVRGDGGRYLPRAGR